MQESENPLIKKIMVQNLSELQPPLKSQKIFPAYGGYNGPGCGIFSGCL